MFRRIIATLAALAFVALASLATRTSTPARAYDGGTYVLGTDDASAMAQLTYDALWWPPFGPPHQQTEHYAHWCFDGRNATTVLGTITQPDVAAAADQWTFEGSATGNVFAFVYDGTCSPTSSTCDGPGGSGGPEDGVNRVYFTDDGLNGFVGDTCRNYNGPNSSNDGKPDGKIREADMQFNTASHAWADCGNAGVSLHDCVKAIALHEFGHMLGLAHDCAVLSVMCSQDAANYTPANDCLSSYENFVACGNVPQPADIAGMDTLYRDTDGDGCVDIEELSPMHIYGGQRDPHNPWDFFDVPAPALRNGYTGQQRDGGIGQGTDILAEAAMAGLTSTDPDYIADRDGNGVADGIQYDRSIGPDPSRPWAMGPPDGGIGLGSDVLYMEYSVGDSCLGGP